MLYLFDMKLTEQLLVELLEFIKKWFYIINIFVLLWESKSQDQSIGLNDHARDEA